MGLFLLVETLSGRFTIIYFKHLFTMICSTHLEKNEYCFISDTEDASETDMVKRETEYTEIKEQ